MGIKKNIKTIHKLYLTKSLLIYKFKCLNLYEYKVPCITKSSEWKNKFIKKKAGGEIMKQESLAPNETMQVHEMLNFKTICMTTSKMMEGVVFDQDLKALLEKDVQQSITAINGLQNLLRKAPEIR